jgi:hypothetical protein
VRTRGGAQPPPYRGTSYRIPRITYRQPPPEEEYAEEDEYEDDKPDYYHDEHEYAEEEEENEDEYEEDEMVEEATEDGEIEVEPEVSPICLYLMRYSQGKPTQKTFNS